jgi:hypothetical protein
MRPATLAESARRARGGEPFDKALVEFLDAFYGAADGECARKMLEEEPEETGDSRWDALLAAVADYLSLQCVRAPPPPWTGRPQRILEQPFFTGVSDAPGIREFLVHSSPAEFKRHNIFTESRPLRRKMTARAPWLGRATGA